MNSIVISGMLSDEPILKKDLEGKKFTDNTLIFSKSNKEKLYIDFKVYEIQAEYLCKYAKKSGRIIITGVLDQLKTYNYLKNQNEYELIIVPKLIEIIDFK